MNLEQLKNDYAVSKGYRDFDDLLINVINYEILSEQINEVMKLYAMECLKLTNKNIGNGWQSVKESIIDENNLIK